MIFNFFKIIVFAGILFVPPAKAQDSGVLILDNLSQDPVTAETTETTEIIVAPNSNLIAMNRARLHAIDRVTARLSNFEANLNEVTAFERLRITLKACYSNPAYEAPESRAFLEIEELLVEGGAELVFSGWMFATSPAINTLEHSIYDVWLVSCFEGADN